MRKCGYCGANIPENKDRCPNCGAPAPEEERIEETAADELPAAEEEEADEEAEEEAGAVGCLKSLVSLGITIYLLWRLIDAVFFSD